MRSGTLKKGAGGLDPGWVGAGGAVAWFSGIKGRWDERVSRTGSRGVLRWLLARGVLALCFTY